MRCIIEVHERRSEPLHALFLDWSKAFVSVAMKIVSERRSNELFLIFPSGFFQLFAELLDFLESQFSVGAHFRD